MKIQAVVSVLFFLSSTEHWQASASPFRGERRKLGAAEGTAAVTGSQTRGRRLPKIEGFLSSVQCEDNSSFEYVITNKRGVSKIMGGCEYVAKKKRNRCRKRINGVKVRDQCAVTCDACELPKYPEGFELGMTPELAGMWVGPEVYKYEGVYYPYCTKAHFTASSFEESNYLTWTSNALDDKIFNTTSPDTYCEVMGTDPLTGSVDKPNYYGKHPGPGGDILPWEHYLLDVKLKTCLGPEYCTYDVTTTEMYKDYELVAKSCGAHLKQYLLYGPDNVCEMYQISRIRNTTTLEEYDIAVLTYGHTFNGYHDYTCANKPTYDMEDFMADSDAVGTTLFVRQSGFAPTPPPNVTGWDCESSII